MYANEEVEKVIKELKSQLVRSPSLDEVARKMIMDPEGLRSTYYRAMKKLGLKPPSKDEIADPQLPFQNELLRQKNEQNRYESSSS